MTVAKNWNNSSTKTKNFLLTLLFTEAWPWYHPVGQTLKHSWHLATWPARAKVSGTNTALSHNGKIHIGTLTLNITTTIQSAVFSVSLPELGHLCEQFISVWVVNPPIHQCHQDTFFYIQWVKRPSSTLQSTDFQPPCWLTFFSES